MSGKPPTAYEVFFGPTNRAVTLTLIRYSMYMILYPLGTFYLLFYIVFDQNKDMIGWCGIAAVVAANLVIAAYVRMAWNEDNGMSFDKAMKSDRVLPAEKRTD